MAPLVQCVYTGENATHDWLCKLAEQPGEVWLESRKGEMVIVHEFEDLQGIRGKEFTHVIIDEVLEGLHEEPKMESFVGITGGDAARGSPTGDGDQDSGAHAGVDPPLGEEDS